MRLSTMRRLLALVCALPLLATGCSSEDNTPDPATSEPLQVSAVAHKAQPLGPVTLRVHTLLDAEHRRLDFNIDFGDGSSPRRLTYDECATEARPYEMPPLRHAYAPTSDYAIQVQVTAGSCKADTLRRTGSGTAKVLFLPMSATPA